MLAETFICKNQTLHLHPLKGVYWEEQQILMLADLHIGKAAHFRKAGIAVPGGIVQASLSQFDMLIAHFQPQRILILGDLFHSTANSEWGIFHDFLNIHHNIQFDLIPGNHDNLSNISLERMPMEIRDSIYPVAPFIFSHQPLEEVNQEYYNIAGHIHPSVRLSGNGRQRLRLPCFYFGEHCAILPAFGAFTGTYDIIPKDQDHIYVIANHQVINIQKD